MPMVTAAFFDVDNTLVKGSSLFLIGRGLLSHGMVRRRDVARFAAEQVLLQVRGEHLGRMQGAQDRALSLGSGLVVDDLVAVATELKRRGQLDVDVIRVLEGQDGHPGVGHVLDLAVGDAGAVPAGAPTRLSGAPAARLGQGRARRPRGLCAAATRSGTVVLGSQQPRAQADQRGFGLGREVSPVTVDRPAPVLGEPPECPIRVDGMGVTGGFQ